MQGERPGGEAAVRLAAGLRQGRDQASLGPKVSLHCVLPGELYKCPKPGMGGGVSCVENAEIST